MSLGQYKATKQYKERHRAEHLEACKQRHIRNKEEDNAKGRKRNREITEGAQRWRKTVGPSYWGLKRTGYR